MKKIKVFALLATLFVGIFSNLLAPTVHAAEGDVTITLHKVKDYAGGTITNTGSKLDLPGLEFLGGITYDVYDVTKEYYTAYDESVATKSVSDAIKDAVKEVQGVAGVAPSGKIAVKTQTTDTDGSTTFSLNAKSGTTTGTTPVPRDAVYLFVEQPKTGITAAEKNLVLSFPVYELNSDGSYTDKELTDIHLYPKNTTDTFEPVKEITTKNEDKSERTNYNIGEEIGFKLSTQIPANIGIKEVDGITPHYNTFGLIDIHDTTLTFNPAGIHELKVPKVADTDTDIVLKETTDYTIVEGEPVVEGKATFKVKLTQAGINKLAEEGGKTLEFTYTMKLNDTAVMDSKNVNKVTVEYGRKEGTFDDVVTTPGNDKEVYTGGYKFVKVDVNNNNKTLAGAEFFVRDAKPDPTDADAPAPKYLKINDTTKEISWVTSVTDATKFTTVANGIVDIKGLTYGTYQLQETKAPEGYALPTGDAAYTEFVVGETPYTTISATPLNIVNTPKGFLPSTGGAGIILFVALGAAMIGLAGVYFTSRRKVA